MLLEIDWFQFNAPNHSWNQINPTIKLKCRIKQTIYLCGYKLSSFHKPKLLILQVLISEFTSTFIPLYCYNIQIDAAFINQIKKSTNKLNVFSLIWFDFIWLIELAAFNLYKINSCSRHSNGLPVTAQINSRGIKFANLSCRHHYFNKSSCMHSLVLFHS